MTTSARGWLAVTLSCAAASCQAAPAPPASKGKKPPPEPPAVSVVGTAAWQGDIGVYLSSIGTVSPFRSVTVRSRVDGQLMEVFFREGEIVSAGDVIAQIDPRPFEAQLTQAEGQLARDRALLQNAGIDLKRYQTLWSQNSISQQILDTQKSQVAQYTGTVKLDEGQVATARLQLTYARITAPVSGRIGLIQVDPGNIVLAADTTGIAVITQLKPIRVLFTVPEDDVQPVLSRLNQDTTLQVDAFNRDRSSRLATGLVTGLDSAIDTSTGTLKLRATFANEAEQLFPNQFVTTSLRLDVLHGATLVPPAAIQRGSQGTYVYVVQPTMVVEVRPVTLGPGQPDAVAITRGLSPGDVVVVDGADRLRSGSKVEMRSPPPVPGGLR